ncbi:MAG: hypothetical protein ABEK36_04545 [Candidatus Aenigmatarchaeota archaeon]
MKLEDYGYNVTSIAKSRHYALSKAANLNGIKNVLSALRKRKSRASDGSYKFKRYRADINWLKVR